MLGVSADPVTVVGAVGTEALLQLVVPEAPAVTTQFAGPLPSSGFHTLIMSGSPLLTTQL